MRTVAALVGLLGWSVALGQAPEGKLLWSNKDFGFGQVLTGSPDGKELFTAHQGFGTEEKHRPVICRWELATGKLLHKYEVEGVGKLTYRGAQRLEYFVELTATPDAKTLLVSWETSRSRGAYSRHRLQRFDLRTGERRGEPIDDLSWHPQGVTADRGGCAVSPDGRWFYAHKDGAMEQLDIFSCETGKVVLSFKIEKDLQASSVAFTEDGSKAAVYFHHCRGEQDPIRLYAMPSGEMLKEFKLPAGKIWSGVHAGDGGRLLVEAMEEDDASKKATEGEAIARPIQASNRKYYSFDPVAPEPGAALKAETVLQGFNGLAWNLPSVCCDAGKDWVAYFRDANRSPEVVQAAMKEKGLQAWREVKVVDRATGKVRAEHKVVPYSCFVTRDGKYLAACDVVPETNAGVFVWRLP